MKRAHTRLLWWAGAHLAVMALLLGASFALSSDPRGALLTTISILVLICPVISIVLAVRLARMHDSLHGGKCVKCHNEVRGFARCPECGTPVGGCKRCGYDLAGIEGRCPECGEPVVARG